MPEWPRRPIDPPVKTPERYSDRPLPGYRYVPRLFPHPVNDPEGHSYPTPGSPPPEGLLPPAQWHALEDYRFGVDLFNHYYWWEAHETWEGLWRQAGRSELQALFLQGLIQIAAAHLKRHLGRPTGMLRLFARATDRLNRVAAVSEEAPFMGLAIRPFLRRTHDYFIDASCEYPVLVLSPLAHPHK